MKKIATLFLALFTVMAVNAELLMHETFPTPGRLSSDFCTNKAFTIDTIDGYQNRWWTWDSYSATYSRPYVEAEANQGLSYPGYATEVAGGAAHLIYNTTTAKYSSNELHPFAPVNSVAGGRLYVAFLMNLDALCTSGMSAAGTWQNILALGSDYSTSNNYAYLQLFLKPDLETFRLGVEKNSMDYCLTALEKNVTSSTSELYGKTPVDAFNMKDYKSPEYNMHETHLVVVEYIFVDNDLLETGQVGNDSVNIYVNPTLNNKVAVAHSVGYPDKNKNTGVISWKGHFYKADPTVLKSVKLKSSKPMQSLYIDQVKVATTWEDLFEGSVDDAAIDVNTHEITKYVVSGGSFSDSIVVTALNLEDDLTIEPADENTVLEVEDDEFDADDEELATGVTIHFSASNLTEDGTDTLIVYSGEVEQRVAINWVVIPSVSTLAEVQDTVYYTGNAQVTYNAVTHGEVRLITIQDETGAIAVDNLDGFAVGDVVTNLVLLGSKKAAVQTAHPGRVYSVSSAEHSEVAYEVTPLVVKADSVNLAEHLYKLIELDTVGLSGLSDNFSNLTIARNSVEDVSNFYVLTPSGNTLLNTPIPATANVVGVVNGIAQTLIDPNSAVWKFICPRGIEDVEEVVKRTLSFSAKTIKIEGTMYVDSTYTSTLVLRGSNLIEEVLLTAENVELGSYEFTADSVNGGATVTITIAPLAADPEWTGNIVATCGDLTATVTMTGVVAANEHDGPGTAVDNVATKVKTVKVIKNGQVRIVRGENEFSVLGEQVK